MFAVVAVSVGGILVALLIAAIAYVIGVYIFHAPPRIVGLIAFLLFVVLALGDVGAY